MKRLPGELVVNLTSGVELGSVADLSFFGPLFPGESVDEATVRHGPPAAKREEHNGTFYRYELEGQKIELAHLRATSTFGGPWENWSLYVYPEVPLETVLGQELQAEIGGGGEPLRDLLIIANGTERDECLSITLSQGRVRGMRWYYVAN